MFQLKRRRQKVKKEWLVARTLKFSWGNSIKFQGLGIILYGVWYESPFLFHGKKYMLAAKKFISLFSSCRIVRISQPFFFLSSFFLSPSSQCFCWYKILKNFVGLPYMFQEFTLFYKRVIHRSFLDNPIHSWISLR